MTRIIENWGDVGDAAESCGVSRPTAYRWQRPGYSLPDVYQAMKISAGRKISPLWLSFGIGPRNLPALQKAIELAEKFDRTPGLAEVVEGYSKATNDDRAIMLRLADKLREKA